MNKCLYCQKDIVQKNGGKERKFCDNNNACKQAYHNKNKKEPKYVLKSTYDALLAKVSGDNKGSKKEESESKKADTKRKYPLTDKDTEPVEGSNAFYLKYGGFTYAELEKLKKS